MFTNDDLKVLLGRSVSTDEEATIQAYVNAALGEVEKVLGFPIVVQTGYTAEAEYTFEKRANRHTIFTPPFTDVSKVVYNGTELADGWDAMWFDDLNTEQKNSIVLEDNYYSCEKLKVTAKWGFKELPQDLKVAIFQYAMSMVSQKDGRGTKTSEAIGSYSVSYGANALAKNAPDFITIFRNYSIKGL